MQNDSDSTHHIISHHITIKTRAETSADLWEAPCSSQDWLHDLFLGYGDPGAAQYWKLPTTLTEIDFRASDFA